MDLSPLQLERVHSQIGKYFERFRNLLGPCNRRYIQTLMVLTRAFLQFLHLENSEGDANTCCEGVSGAKSANDGSMAINEFLFSLNIDNINLVKLLRYIKESNIVHKVRLFCALCVIYIIQRSLSIAFSGLRVTVYLPLRSVAMVIKRLACIMAQHSKMEMKAMTKEAACPLFKH